jgi:predicted RNA binding protein YcfA (HicA-like mRNA interferase family)
MGALDCIKLRQLRKLLQKHGFVETRQTGSHLIIEKQGILNNIVIPIHSKEVLLYNVKGVMKVLNMTREEFLKELKKC